MSRTLPRSVCALMIVATMWVAQACWAATEAGVVRTVQGEVVAVNLQAEPNAIVVKVILPSKQAMLVGAMVKSGVPITRGKQAIRLEGITAGQRVSLTYAKSETGLDARSIQVQK